MSKNNLVKYIHKFEDQAAFMGIFLLALIHVLEVIARKFFHTGIAGSTDYSHHLVLVLTFIGGMITSREGQHLSLALTLKIEEPLKSRLHTAVMTVSAMMTTAFCWSSLSFILTGFDPAQKVGVFPIRLVAMIMVVGYAIMAIRFVTATPKKTWYRVTAGTGILLGTILALEPIGQALTALLGEAPGFIEPMVQFSHSVNALIALPVILLLIVLTVFGAPIFVVLGGIAFMLFARLAEPLEVIPNQAYAMLISHSIPAIPLFTAAGFILSESKAGERLVRFFKAFFGWFPGGLAIMSVLVCSFFTTFTGASGVTILALGALLSYSLLKGNYGKQFTTGLLTASGSIGLLFPPSLPIIIYGVIAQINIKEMFLGGIIPGFFLVLSMVIFSIIYASKKKIPRESFKIKEAVASTGNAIWEILLPVVIVAAYFGGLTTLVESAAIALLYALVVEVIIHRDLKIKDLPAVIAKGIPIIGGVMIILSLANGLSYFIIDAEIPMKLTAWVQANISSKYVFLLLLNVALLITGCFLDIFSAIMVVVPLILPLGNLFGIHPVHLGIIFLANLELGYLTPPVGLNLYLAAYRFNEPLGKIYRDVFPFLLIQLLTVLMITYIPLLSTGLLKLIKL
ncbi:MAG: TRAP transporter large permease subunit [Candidatus Aminicenantes bacterium]|nr:TRAP transporter large permease subunit [Candidatus Aminicenantes bacterium]